MLALGLGACESTVVGPEENDGPPVVARFAADIQPLFARRCNDCHVGTATSGVELTTHADVRASIGVQYGGPVVRPGDAAGSPLVDKIEAAPRFGARMPQGGALSDAEIAQVRAWIDAGALND